MNPWVLVLLFQAAPPQEVRASSFGFDPEDATKALQAAIDSGAKKVIVENLGRPWVVTPIRLSGGQEIVFEKGVVVQAKRGAFRGKNECLFSAVLVRDLVLTGYGATLRMWKGDYQRDYEKSEWRHALSLRSCANVRVLGLTIAESGGDGIYLGVARPGVPCRDVVLRDVVCEANHRQGISVISAENLLIENCVLKDTGGTPPQAGIDFEPNRPDECLVRCVMRDCVSEGNRGCGFAFWLGFLDGTSAPVSVRLEHCRASGNKGPALMWGTRNQGPGSFPQGTGDFVFCRFEKSEGPGLRISGNPASGCRLRFDRCTIADCVPAGRDLSPITFTIPRGALEDVGNVEFADSVVRDPLRRRPLTFVDGTGRRRIARVTGSLMVEEEGKTVRHVLDGKTLGEWMPVLALKAVPPVSLAGMRFAPALPGSTAGDGDVLRLRGDPEFLLYAEKGRAASFAVRVFPVGPSDAPAAVHVVSPSGKEISLPEAPSGRKTPYEFPAEETGAYRVRLGAGGAAVVLESAARGLAACGERAPLHLFHSAGTFYFWVPPGTVEFGVRITGGGIGEAVRASLHGPGGRTVEERDNIVQPHLFVARPEDPGRGEVWSLRLGKPSEGVLEDFFVDLLGIPPLLAASPGALLKPVKP